METITCPCWTCTYNTDSSHTQTVKYLINPELNLVPVSVYKLSSKVLDATGENRDFGEKSGHNFYVGEGLIGSDSTPQSSCKASEIIERGVGRVYIYKDTPNQYLNVATIGSASVPVYTSKFTAGDGCDGVGGNNYSKVQSLNVAYVKPGSEYNDYDRNGFNDADDKIYLTSTTSKTIYVFPKTGYDIVRVEHDGIVETVSNKNSVGTYWLDKSYSVLQTETSYTCTATFNYSVVYDANGGTGSMSTSTFEHGKTYDLPQCTLKRHGHIFTGWNTAADGSGTDYADCAEVENLTDDATSKTVTLYAMWEEGVKVYVDGGDESIGTIKVKNSSDAVVAESVDGVLEYYCKENESYKLYVDIVDRFYKSAYIQNGETKTNLPHTFTASDEISGTINFVAHPLHGITISPTTNGSISITSPDGPDKDGKYLEQDVEFTASADEGYEPTNCWVYSEGRPVANGTFTNGKFTLQQSNFKADVTVQAKFARKTYTVLAESSNDNYGTVSSASQTVPHGDTATLTATSKNASAYRFEKWTYKDGGGLASLENPYSFTVTAAASLVANFIVTKTGNVNLSVAYGVGDVNVGSILCDGVVETYPKTLSKPFGTVVNLEAVIVPGAKFCGWYSDSSCTVLVSQNARYSYTMIDDSASVYAKFSSDGGKILAWEGSSDNKTMTWRSKTYVASVPFNPSCCRVDSTGYGNLALKVDTFSSPDVGAKATGSASLSNIANQDARRLPIRRPERYMQVEVKNDAEVDTVLVGTSMKGMAV